MPLERAISWQKERRAVYSPKEEHLKRFISVILAALENIYTRVLGDKNRTNQSGSQPLKRSHYAACPKSASANTVALPSTQLPEPPQASVETELGIRQLRVPQRARPRIHVLSRTTGTKSAFKSTQTSSGETPPSFPVYGCGTPRRRTGLIFLFSRVRSSAVLRRTEQNIQLGEIAFCSSMSVIDVSFRSGSWGGVGMNEPIKPEGGIN